MIVRLILLLTVFAVASFAQPPAPKRETAPPHPVAKGTPPPTTELTEEQFQTKIIESVLKPVSWKQYSLPNFDIDFDMPREPIRQSESFYDEATGNMKLEMQFSVGEGVSFVVGHMKLPYAITDQKLIDELFDEMAKELNMDPDVPMKRSGEYIFEGHRGVEMVGSVSRAGFLDARLRGFLMGRSVYLLAAMPIHSPAEDEPLSKEQVSSFQKEVDRFFASLKMKTTSPPAASAVATTVSPIFGSTFTDGTFRSEYFKFSIKFPTGWLKVSDSDVEGLRQVGRDYMSANSAVNLPEWKTRQNLATLASKPLGSERIAMVAINVSKKTPLLTSHSKIASITETFVSKLQTYEVTKKVAPTKLGGLDASVFETTIRMTDVQQYQVVYFFERKEHLIALTLTYHDAADRKAALSAVEGIVFEAL